MANYVYADTNTDLTLTFETESFGGNLISYTGASSGEDYGSLDGTPTNTLAATPLLAESSVDGDRGEIANQDISPMGAIASMSSTTNEAFARTTYIGSGSIGAYGASAPSLKRIWVGSGTLFEMGGGMERSSAFWVGSGGLTVAGTKEERVAGHYSDTLFVPFNSEDFGAGFATTSSFDVYGIITDPLDAGIDDYGFTYNTTDVRGASGILPLTNGPNAQGNTYAQSRKYIASGSLFSASGVVEATVAQPVEDTALFTTSGSSVFRITNDWVGSGNIALAGAGVDKLIVDYSIDSDLLLSDDDYGTLEPRHEGYLQNLKFILGNAPYFPTPDNGEITEPLSEGEDDYGSIVFGQRRRTVHDVETVEAASGKFTLGERKETGLRYQTRTLATGVPDLPINRYEWVGSGTMVGFRGEVFDVHKPIFGQAGSGSLFALGGAAESKTVDLPESTGLYQFQGHVFPETKLDHWTGSGSLFGFGGLVEAATFHYNISSTLPYSTEDYGAGFTTTSTEDIGLITEIQSGGEENWYYINHLGPATPFGPATFANGPDAQGNTYARVRPFIASGSLFSASGAAEAVSSNPPETTALVSFSGSGVEKSIFREVFSGSLFSVGGGVEKVTFDYNLSSINLFTTEDRDLVTNSASTNEDFGSTTEGIPQGAVDFDHIVFTQDAYGTTGGLTWSLTRDGWTQEEIDEKLFINADYVTPETGLVPVAGVEQTQEESGDVKYIPIFGQFGQGSLFAVGGAAETVAISEETTEKVLVELTPSDIINAATSGTNGVTLETGGTGIGYAGGFNIGPHILFGNGYQLIRFPLDLRGVEEISFYVIKGDGNNGRPSPSTGRSFGVHIGSAAFQYLTLWNDTDSNLQKVTLFVPLAQRLSSVQLVIYNEASTTDSYGLEGIEYLAPAPSLFSLSGSTTFSAVTDYVASGSLSTLSGCVESATFDYNDSTVVTFTTDDQGLITASGSIVDYGSITNPLTAGIQNNGTVIHTTTVNAATGTYTFSDTATEKNIVREVFGGSLFSVGGAVEVAGVAEESTGLFATSGSSVFRVTTDWVGSGSLFTLNGCAESATFDYNETTVVTFTTDDQGLITATGSIVDYGSITNPLTAGIANHGTVIHTSTVNAVTGTYTFSSTTTEKNVVREVFGGSLFSFGGAVEAATFDDPDSTLIATLSGHGIEKSVFREIMGGSLFSVGGGVEKVTFDYNLSSIVTYATPVDNGLISSATTTTADNGSIADPLTEGIDDLGTIIYSQTVEGTTGGVTFSHTRPSWTQTEIDDKLFINPDYVTPETGLVPVVGVEQTQEESGDVKYIPVFAQIGSGSLFAIGGAVEVAGVAEEATGLFRLFTSAAGIGNTYRFCWNAPPVTGGLFSIGGCAESATWDYNESAIVTFSSEDNDLITNAVQTTADNGFITDPLTAGIQNNGTVIHTATVYPVTGVLAVGSTTTFSKSNDYIGSGSISTFSGQALIEKAGVAEESTGLFSVSGSSVFRVTNDWVGSGSLFTFNGGVEKVTFDYNDTTIVTFSTDDQGLITATGSIVDYGSITNPLTAGIQNNGTVIHTSTVNAATGLIDLTGVGQTPRTRPFIGSGSLFTASGAAETVAFDEEFTGLFRLFTSAAGIGNTYRFCWNAPPVTGSLFSVGGGVEKVTFDYGDQVIFSSDDYGSITASTNPAKDHFTNGLVAEPLSEGEEDYNTILYNQTVDAYDGGTGPVFTFGYRRAPLTQEDIDLLLFINPDYVTPETGLVPQVGDEATQEQSGDVKYEPAFAQIGSGSLFAVGGAAEAVAVVESTIGLFSVSGSTAYARTRPFIGSGSLFTLNGAAESATWDYNETSIVVFTSADYGNVTGTPATGADYIDTGFVNETTTDGEINYGTVVNTSTVYPLTGSYVVSGDSADKKVAREIGGGTLSTFSGQALVEKVTFAEEATTLYDVVGTAVSTRARDFVGSGSLFTLNGCAEAVTWDYNEDSIDVFSSEDNGLISATATVLEDNGLITDPLTAGEENNGTVINTATTYPYGTIDLTGVAQTPRTRDFVGSGSLFTASGAVEVAVVDYESTYLFTVVGTTTFSRSRDFVGSGSLFSVGGGVEKVTFDYNDDTVLVYTGIDNGLITDAATTTADDGSISSPVSAGEESNGLIAFPNRTLRATTGTIQLGLERDFLTQEEIDLLLFINPDYVTPETGLVPQVGDQKTQEQAGHVKYEPIFFHEGSGSILTIGGAAEAAAVVESGTGLFALSTSPAFIGNTYRFCWKWTGSGNLPIIGGAAESRTYDYSDELLQPFTQVDNGLISAATTTTDDNGSLVLPTTAGEEDNGSILNTVITPAQGTYTVSGATAVVARSSYVGAGSLFTAGGAAEVVAQTDDTTGLFTVSGVADTIRSRTYVGTGTLNALSGVAESRTWVYDRDLPAVLTSEDYGSVDASATSNEDQGQVSNPLTTGEVDYGEDGTLAHLTDPAHGTYTISGVANTPFERRYIGSGSYGGFSGTADDRFARFAIVDGFGTYTLFTAPAFIGNTYRFAFKFVGSGTLPVFGGLVESTTTNPPEDTVLFTGSGTAVERQADRWVGSGSLFTAGGVADTVTVNEAATGLFTVSGAGIEKHTERYIGTATAITLSGTAVERATQDYVGDTAQYTLSGSAVERESNAEVGSGSLFTTGGAAESKTSNPPESTVIFVVGGSKAESFTPATEVGSGSLFSVGGLVESFTVNEAATGLYTISGQVVFNYVVSFVGSGSLFTAGGAAESKTTNKPESTVLFAASGTGAEAATVREVFVGGTLSTFSGQALIERVAVAEEDTTLYTFSGAVEFIYRVRYPGSGTINLLSGAAEAAAVAEESTGLYEFQGSKDESFTPAPYIGSGSYGGFSGTRVSEKHTEAYFGITQPYVVSGTGTVSVEYHFTGVGNLFTSSGAAESTTTNPPEDTALFTVLGSIGTAAVTKDFVGFGSYGGFSGTCVERVAQADEEGGTITLSGAVVFKLKYMPVVGGNLFTVGGAAERVTFNPPEDTYLLRFAGSKAESFSPAGNVGFGRTTLSGTRVSEKHTERYVGDSAQFTYSGEATNVRFIPNWVGSGSIYLTGDGDTTRARDFVGSGSLFTAGGLAESITTNTPESTVLFTAAGQSVERHTESYVGSGSATLSGEATDIKVIRYFDGSGSLFTFSGAAESATFVETAIGLYGIGGFGAEAFVAQPPEDTAQYTFSGNAVEEQLDHYTGSGVMDFLEGGAAVIFAEEKITFSPDGFGLFTFSGTSPSAVSRPYIGSGNISTFSGQAIDEKVTFADDETLQVQLSGESVSKFTGSFLGSGSLFTASGAAESTTTNPPEDTVLFTVSGTAQTPRARDFVGSGSIVITGSAEERTVQPHVGTGSLFAVGGAAEAVAFADADTLIARFSGGANESFIRSGYQATGSATLSGTSEEKHTERYVGDTAQYTISGGATEVRFVPHFNGSGSLFTASGAAESKTTNKPESTVLFTFSGAGKERLVNSRHTGSGTITLSGDATTEYRKFEVGFTFVTII